MTRGKGHLPARSGQSDIDAFLANVAATAVASPGQEGGRLMFAMDATASRESSWDQACHIQAQMFSETEALGGLDVQLCYFRGFGEFHSSAWMRQSTRLLAEMERVRCMAGATQIERVLRHAASQAGAPPGVDALVLVGDCMEEDIDEVCAGAGALGLIGVPTFVFHEGFEPIAERAFREIARLTRGAYSRFDAASPGQLKDLLSAVAVYAAGGRGALESFGQRRGGLVKRLTQQIG